MSTFPPPPQTWPPPAQGQPQPWASPPPRRQRRRPAHPSLFIGLAVFAVGLLVAGVVAFVHDRNKEPSYPAQWDPRVASIVKFDEQHRGLKFKHPVEVDFLSPDEYAARARSSASQLSDDDKKKLASEEGELRAMGLTTGNVDLFAALNDLADAGTAAFYDPDTKKVSVRGTDMTVELQVTLAHELTHALQDQHFDISSARENSFKTSGESDAFRTLVEGDAERIEHEYVASLSADQQSQYFDSNSASVEQSQQQLSNVPVALQAFMAAPYIFGPPFTEILQTDGGQHEVDAAFAQPPVDDEQTMDPRQFVHDRGPLDVAKPPLPQGVSAESDSGDLGETTWYLMLAERIPPVQALHAADGWGGDSYVAYDQSGRTCMRMAWRGDSSVDQDEMHTALDAWAAAMPAGTATVREDGGQLSVETCDPGADSGITINNRSLDALELFDVRSNLMVSAMQEGHLSVDDAFTFGQCVIDAVPYDVTVKVATSQDAPPQSFLAAVDSCR